MKNSLCGFDYARALFAIMVTILTASQSMADLTAFYFSSNPTQFPSYTRTLAPGGFYQIETSGNHPTVFITATANEDLGLITYPLGSYNFSLNINGVNNWQGVVDSPIRANVTLSAVINGDLTGSVYADGIPNFRVGKSIKANITQRVKGNFNDLFASRIEANVVITAGGSGDDLGFFTTIRQPDFIPLGIVPDMLGTIEAKNGGITDFSWNTGNLYGRLIATGAIRRVSVPNGEIDTFNDDAQLYAVNFDAAAPAEIQGNGTTELIQARSIRKRINTVGGNIWRMVATNGNIDGRCSFKTSAAGGRLAMPASKLRAPCAVSWGSMPTPLKRSDSTASLRSAPAGQALLKQAASTSLARLIPRRVLKS